MIAVTKLYPAEHNSFGEWLRRLAGAASDRSGELPKSFETIGGGLESTEAPFQCCDGAATPHPLAPATAALLDRSVTTDPRGQPAFAGISTFLHLPWVEEPEAIAALAPDFAIVGAPFDVAVTHRPGARFGPRAIRDGSNLTAAAFHHLGLGIEPLSVLTGIDAGDAFCPPGDLIRGHDGIRAKLRSLLAAAPACVPLVLGGDHSITYPSAATIADHHDRRVGIVHFDAHADTADQSWGVSLSHGTPMRRLIEGGHVAGRNFVQVGLRGYWPPPDVIEWMREHGMRSHFMREIEERGFDTVLGEAVEQALDGPDLIYLSVDIDVLDPAFAPGTGTPEPGGLSSRELLRAVRRVALETQLCALDVVEVCPPYDVAGITAEAAHRVCCEAISGMAARSEGQRGSRTGD